MDIIHHTVMGGIAMVALSGTGHEVAGAAFLAGSVLPDLDVLLVVFGKRAYWKNHQGATHSLLVAPILSLLIAWPLFAITQNWIMVYAMGLSGVLLHIVLDWSNTFGIGLFWPLDKNRYALDAVFLIDLWAWGLTLFFLWQLAVSFTLSVAAAVVYGGVFTFYVVGKILLQRRVCVELACRSAIPSSVNPFTFYILEETSHGVRTYLYNWLLKKKWQEHCYPTVPEKYRQLARSSHLFCDMEKIVRFLFITEVVAERECIMITAQDLSVRNYGGRFGRTVLRFEHNGRLLAERANL